MLNIVESSVTAQGISSFVHEGFMSFTAVQANQVLNQATYDRQRKISSDHVAVLADIMKHGQWEPKDKLDFALFKGDLILVNGYHRMTAQVACGKTIEWTVVVHQCRSMDAVRSLYYKFDTNTKIRQASQVLAGVGFADKTGLSRQMAVALFNAVPFIASGFGTSKRDQDILVNRVMDRRLALASQYVDAAREYEICLEGTPARIKKKFMSGGVTAVALVTLRYQSAVAADFWKGAASNDGLRKGDPRLTLYNDLNSRQMNAGSSSQSVNSPATAWNAYFDNRNLKIIKVYARRAVTISGTPFEG